MTRTSPPKKTSHAWTLAATALIPFAIGASGCAGKHRTIAEAFPKAAQLSPWILSGEVWEGPAAEAKEALGVDWNAIAQQQPGRTWLAVYKHERQPGRTVTARLFEFADERRARRAFESWKPLEAEPFHAGVGCWTPIGVMLQRGRLVLEVFGDRPDFSSQTQAASISGFIEKRLPAVATDGAP